MLKSVKPDLGTTTFINEKPVPDDWGREEKLEEKADGPQKKLGPSYWLNVILLFVVLLTSMHDYARNENLEEAFDAKAHQLVASMDDLAKSTALIAREDEQEIIFLKIVILNSKINKELGWEIAEAVQVQSDKYKRDSDLVLAMIRVESNFDPNAISSVGAEGLMQVMPQWKEQLAIEGDLKDIETNINYGLQILAFYSQMYKDIETALSAYNRGPGMIDYDLRTGQDPNRNGYAERVLTVYEELKKLSPKSSER